VLRDRRDYFAGETKQGASHHPACGVAAVRLFCMRPAVPAPQASPRIVVRCGHAASLVFRWLKVVRCEVGLKAL
jgi:hypothetical protein